MNYKKSKRKELRRKYENLLGQRFVEGLEKEPMVGLTEWVDIVEMTSKWRLGDVSILNS